MRSLGFALDEASLQQIAYANGIEQTYSTMTQAEKAQLRYIALMTQIPQVQGDMARTLSSAANSLRVLQQQFTLLGREIGNIFIPLLNAIIPIAIAVVKVLGKVAKAIASLFGFTLPDLNWDGVQQTTGTVASDLEDANGSATKLKRQLAGFDELNNLTTPSSGGSGTGASPVGGDFDIPLPEYDMLEGLDKGIEDLTQQVMDFLGLTEDASGKLSWSFEDMDTKAKALAITLGALAGIKLANKFINIGKSIKGVVDNFKSLSSIGVVTKLFGSGGLSGAVTSFVTAAGGVGPAVAVVGTWLVGLTSTLKVLKENWDKVKDTIELFLEKIGFEEKIKNLKDSFDSLKETLDKILTPLGGLKGALEGIQNVIGTGILVGFLPILSLAAGFINTIVNALDGMATVLEGISKMDIGKVFNGLIESAKAIFGIDFLGGIGNFLSSVIEGFEIDEKLSEIGDSISTWWSEFWNGLFTSVSTWWNETWSNVKTFFSETWDGIKTKASETWEGIKETWNTVSTWFSDNVITPVKEGFSEGWDKVSTFASDSWSGIKETWSKVTNWFGENVTNPISKDFSNIWNKLKTGASDAWQGIKDVFSKVANWFEGIFSEAWQKVKGVFSSGGQVFENIKEGISTTFKNIVNGLITGINNVVSVPFNAINNTLNTLRNLEILGAKPFSGIQNIWVPQIPLLYEKGGFPDTGEFFMARESGPEMVGRIGNRTAVANNDQIVEAIERGVYRATVNANSGGSGTNYFNVNVGNRKVYSGMAQSVKNENNRYGKSVIEV